MSQVSYINIIALKLYTSVHFTDVYGHVTSKNYMMHIYCSILCSEMVNYMEVLVIFI